jgi:hypothetical protein
MNESGGDEKNISEQTTHMMSELGWQFVLEVMIVIS